MLHGYAIIQNLIKAIDQKKKPFTDKTKVLEAGYMHKRIENLRSNVFSADDNTVFIERFYYLKQAYEKYRDEPAEILHALITSEILSNISIVIGEDDLIVGWVREVVATSEDEELLQDIWNIEPESLPPPFFNYAARPEVFSKVFPDQDGPLFPDSQTAEGDQGIPSGDHRSH